MYLCSQISEPIFMSKFHTLSVKDIRRETEDCVSIAFEVPTHLQQDFQFIQGQYLTLLAKIDGADIRRSYSICSSPLDNELRVAVKQVYKGIFSTYANQQLKVGDKLEVMPPEGRFFTPINPENKKNYVGFAAGSGITPILSILKTVLQSEPNSTFTLFYGNKNRGSIIFKESLEALKNKYMGRLSLYQVLSQEQDNAPIFNGRLSAEKCAVFSPKLIDLSKVDECFLCGPEEMIFDIQGFLEKNGLDKKHIHFELFTSNAQKAQAEYAQTHKADEDKQSKVSIIVDGTTFDLNMPYLGKSVLDAALNVGADLPFACKGGVCCTCRAKVIEGEVEMAVNYSLEPAEVAAGFVLTCQAYPKSERLVIDFDVK